MRFPWIFLDAHRFFLILMKEEYICPMPFDVDTANIGLRWWACQALQNFTGDGEGVQWDVNEE